MKTGIGLAAFAESLLSDRANTWYMYGNNGHEITEWFIQVKKEQYPDRYSDAHIAELRKHIGAIGYDCSSIMDLYLGKDYSANGWLNTASVKGPISTIPEIVGLSVHYPGHVGIYVGGGYVVEARGTWYGIVKTRLADRPWKNWAKVPGLEYEESDINVIKVTSPLTRSEAVYLYQGVVKSMGYDIGAYADMKTGERNGRDGIYGETMETITNQLRKKYGLAQTGIVDADLYGKIALELSSKAGDVSKEQLDVATNRIKALESELQTQKAIALDRDNKLKNVRSAIDTLKMV